MENICPVEKNRDYIMRIDDIGNDGEGIGKIEGFTVFVKDALPQEKVSVKIVKVKKNFAYGRLMEIIEPSENRVQPKCGVYKRCGGCSLQHLSYEAQLDFKTKKVYDALTRIGGFKNPTVERAVGMDNPFYYRNKAQFPVGKDKNGVKIGFYAPRSHDIVDVEECIIQNKINRQINDIIRCFITEEGIEPYDESTGRGLLRHIVTRVGFVTGEVLVCLVVNGRKIPSSEKLVKKLRDIKGVKGIVLNVNTKKTNVILGDEIIVLWGQNFITDYIGNVKFEVSIKSFYQVNPLQTKVLYEKALELAGLSGDENVLDLYCGIGTISLFLAQKAKNVIGIEIVEQAVKDAERNAEINGFKNARFIAGSAEEVIPDIYKNGFKPDLIVVDPPRKGCDSVVIDTIVKMSPQKVVYVSCDPSTLARDLKILCERGYKFDKVHVVDQFCHSTHVETVILMTYCGNEAKNEG